MREQCIQLENNILNFAKKNIKKEPQKVYSKYIEVAECFDIEQMVEKSQEYYFLALKLLVNKKNNQLMLTHLSLSETLKVFQKITIFIKTNELLFTQDLSEEINNFIEALIKENAGSFNSDFLISETLSTYIEVCYTAGILEKQAYQKHQIYFSKSAEEAYERGIKNLERTNFAKARNYLSMAAILFQNINDPKMDLAFEQCAKASTLQAKYELSQKKYLQGLEALLMSIKIYQTLNYTQRIKELNSLFRKSYKNGIDFFESKSNVDDKSVKKLLLLEEKYRELEREIPIEKTSDSINEPPVIRIHYPKIQEPINEKSPKNDLLKEKFALEQSLESLQEAFRDGLISSEDYARLLLGINRNLYKVRHFLNG